MADLAQEKCVPYRDDEPALADPEIDALLPRVPDWEVVERKGIKRLQRVFKFADFAQALGFTNRVGELAEGQGHHPAILTEWGRVTVMWWTHKVVGLHRNDFVMAAKTDRSYASG